jgi:hypothetical protein
VRAQEFVTENWGIEKYPIPLPIGQYLAVGSDEFAPPGNYASADDLVDDVYDLIDAGVEPRVVAVDPKTLLATQDWLSNASGDGPLFDEYPDRPVIYQKAGKLYILDGHHRTTRAWKANRPISVYLFRDDQQNELDENLSEAFDQPYPLAWEKSDYGDVDALARLPDGGPLSIMFNKQTNDEGDEAVQVEFYRNNSQEVTSEGDAMRVFATVLTAIQQYVKEYQPKRLTFSASKEIDPTIHYEPGQAQPNPESRAKLYDRLVQRYSKTWGYRAYRADSIGLVTYELARMRNVAENFADGKVKGKSRPGRVKRAGASCNGSVTDLRARAKRASGEKAKMYHWCANMKSGRNKNK